MLLLPPCRVSIEDAADAVLDDVDRSRNRVGRDRQTGCKRLEQNEAERIRPARKAVDLRSWKFLPRRLLRTSTLGWSVSAFRTHQ